MWHSLIVNLFHLGTGDAATVSVLEKIIRPVAVYLVLVFALLRFGKRILAQLNPFDLVVLLTLSNTVQNAIIGNDTSLSGGVIGAAALLAINAVLVRIYYRGPLAANRFIEDRDVYLIKDFRPQYEVLRRWRINVGELTARAHERGFDNLDEAESAALYANGTIDFRRAEQQTQGRQMDEILRELHALREQVANLGR